ncbi:hypothetical protein ACGFZP_29900 [Kitasatospora sp. NPDC048239]|uniref:hypothetical protein n=1 Tax=Kitasatospora sp. NPDC048239 TaxID=3364046 RepID=UPI003714823A
MPRPRTAADAEGGDGRGGDDSRGVDGRGVDGGRGVDDGSGGGGNDSGNRDGGGGGVPGDGEPTAARLRAGLAGRLRTAHDRGRSVDDLAAACRRPVAEVQALLAEGRAAAGGAEGFTRLRLPAEPGDETAVPVLRAPREELRTGLAKRPSPSRRLRRMHPETPGAGASATASESGRTGSGAGAPPNGPRTAAEARPAAPAAAAPAAETPLGILIGGTPNLPEATGRPEERRPVRVAAEPVRVGRGTSLVVLPAWRSAIAVSVPTEQLLDATGLRFDQLAEAQLSVLINPGALHDRELELHGWRVGPAGRPGRRGGRST